MMWPFMIDYTQNNPLTSNTDNNFDSKPNTNTNLNFFSSFGNSNPVFNWYNIMFSQAEQIWETVLNSNISAKDRRFSSQLWQDHGVYQYLANSYLLTCRNIIENINKLDIDENEKIKCSFFTKQYLDAVAPSNFIATNPQAIQSIIDSNGQSIIDGMTNYMSDLQKGHITQTKDDYFMIGKNIASTNGDIIYKTPLFELIRYKNDKITQLNPVLIIPPCINKYYILDLQKHNSVVAYLLEQGFDVCLISWKNIQEEDNNFTWDDYIQSIQNCIYMLSEQAGVHTVGFCIGGTLISCAIAADKNINTKIASLSLFTALIDFSDSGILKLLIDENQFNYRKPSLIDGSLMSGAELASVFNALRPQELIWKYVTENYLQGKNPASFDILHWNSDSTNLSGAMYCWYIENTYLKNNIISNNAIVNGEKIDIKRMSGFPVYAVGCEEDHIVPWHGALKSVKYLTKFNADITFILSSSGHIAGIVNPPTPDSKRNYYVFEDITNIDLIQYDKLKTIENSNKIAGSWWGNWADWLIKNSEKVTSRNINKIKKHDSLYPTPSKYVQEKC